MSYHNVEIQYISGRVAVLTVFDDGVEKENIVLSDYTTKESIHELFQAKGFVKKTRETLHMDRADTKVSPLEIPVRGGKTIDEESQEVRGSRFRLFFSFAPKLTNGNLFLLSDQKCVF